MYTSAAFDKSFYNQDIEIIVEDIQQAIDSGITQILFDNMHEGMLVGIVAKINTIIKLLYYSPLVKFYLLVSSVESYKPYIEYCKITNTPLILEIIEINIFEAVIQGNYLQYKKDKSFEYVIKKKDKKFVCFNKIERPHRVETIATLIEKKLLEKGYCSFEITPNKLITAISYAPSKYGPFLLSILDKVPLRLNITESRINPVDIVEKDIEYHENSYFSIVTETFFYKKYTGRLQNYRSLDTIYLTEKTFRPIVLKHPFILLSRPKSLNRLKQLGYKTFEPFFNEAYDSVEDDDLRFQLIMNEIERLCLLNDDDWLDLQRNLKPILDHNHEILLSKNDFTR